MAWKFWFIQDREILKKLARSKSSGSIPVGRAPLGVVVGADSSLTDVWVEDCSIASIIIQLTAQSLGLGSCWIQIRNRERKGGESSESYVKDLIGSDSDDIRIESIISIGYSKENKSPVEREDLPDNAVYFI